MKDTKIYAMVTFMLALVFGIMSTTESLDILAWMLVIVSMVELTCFVGFMEVLRREEEES